MRTLPFVIVSGPPGSEKSTLAACLADRLALPLLAKDTITEAVKPGPARSTLSAS